MRSSNVVSGDQTHTRDHESGSPKVDAALVFYHRDGAVIAALPETGTLTIGRVPPADIVVADRSISRTHATVRGDRGVYVVSDAGSRNGVRVRGERIESCELFPGDEVMLGDVLVVLQLRGTTSQLSRVMGFERFRAELVAETRRAQTFGRPFSILRVRTGGANAHVRHWSADLMRALRDVDLVGYYSETELLVLTPETPPAAARGIADRILREVAGAKVSLSGFPDDAAGAEELLSRVREPQSATGAQTAAPSSAPPSTLFISPKMREVEELVRRVGPSQLSVLILGETGTGKELIARAIHEGSPRARAPLRTVNCAAIPATLLEGQLFGHEKGAFTGADRRTKGIFEQAEGGTVFLDEVGELSPGAQAALLRVLETRKVLRIGADREIDVNVRLVAATHRDLEQMVEAGTFRRDLLFRLDGMTIVLPPLRDRGDEIEQLALRFLDEANAANERKLRGFAPEALTLFYAYDWPGNVRELKNAVERAVVISRGNVIGPGDLPQRMNAALGRAAALGESMAPPPALSTTYIETAKTRSPLATLPPPDGETRTDDSAGDMEFRDRVRVHAERYERTLIEQALARHPRNMTRAAAELRIPLRTLSHKIRELGIRRSDSGEGGDSGPDRSAAEGETGTGENGED